MSGSTPVSGQSVNPNDGASAGCGIVCANGALCGETEGLKILEQFQKVYAERLKQLDGNNELAMNTLKSWIHDLTEQNTLLVQTVEELEQELLKRVDLMHDQLQKTSLVIKRNEHLAKRERSEVEVNLREQVLLLQKDVSSLLDIINQAKQQGRWSIDNVKLHTVNKCQLTASTSTSLLHGKTDTNEKSQMFLKSSLQELSELKPSKDKIVFHDACSQTDDYLAQNPVNCMGDGHVTYPTTCSQTKEKHIGLENFSSNVCSTHMNSLAQTMENSGVAGQVLELSAPKCNPCQQFWHSSSDKVYQTCFPVSMDQESFILCTVPTLNNFSENTVASVVTSATQSVSYLKNICSQHVPPITPSQNDADPTSSTKSCEVPFVSDIKDSHLVKDEKTAKSSCDALSCNYSDSLEDIHPPTSTTLSQNAIEPVPKYLSRHSIPLSDAPDAFNTQDALIGNVDYLKSQLADKDAEIHNLLERIEEMQDIFTLTSKQVKLAVEAEQKSLQELATQKVTNENLLLLDRKDDVGSVSTASWTQERIKQQQEQITSLISKIRGLEADHESIKRERDHFACELKACKKYADENQLNPCYPSPEPSLIICSKELESTRQKFAEATKQVHLLAACVKNLEKENYETKADLTAEVKEKHDQMLELRREVHQLEEQVKNACMQTHFRDNIIREMRNELKIAHSKKTRRKPFPAIPEAISVVDSGVDDGDTTPSSCVQVEVDLLRSQLNEQVKQISAKEKEVIIQKQRIQALEKELNEVRNSTLKLTATPRLPSISLRELEEYRLCTVEGQAAVEELQDEIEAIVCDLKNQEMKAAEIEKAAFLSKETMQNAQQKLARELSDPVAVHQILGGAKDCLVDLLQKSEDFVQDRRSGEQRRAARERKVTKLQEQLDTAHDNMRDGIEAMEQSLADRYEADRLSHKDFSDGSSYHSCRESDSSSCVKQVERLEENKAELLINLTAMECQKRDAEAKASQCLREIEKLKEQISRKSFTDEILRTKEQTILELQGALESARRQVKDIQSEYERTAKERDSVRVMLEQQSNSRPLQVAELQSELARVRNQLATMSSKQALVEQYERRVKDLSDQTEKLSSQLNTLTLNLQAKETMLSNKEEMIKILQDTLDRTHEEMRQLKEKSVSKSSFGLPWRNGKKKMSGPSPSLDKAEQDGASGFPGGVSDEQWQLVRELKLDLSIVLAQYQECFSEVSRQTRWFRDLQEAYQDLRFHAENVKKEALLSVSSSQRETEALKRQCNAQSMQICHLKEQAWEAEQGRRLAETEMQELKGRIASYSQQIYQFQSRLESLQTQLKDTQTRMTISEDQVELRQLREFRDKWEQAARSFADVDQQDKECWGGLQWCESSESEDSQKREAKLEATLGLLMVEAGRRRRMCARDAVPKDCDSASTDGSGASKPHKPTPDPVCDSQWTVTNFQQCRTGAVWNSKKCRLHGPAAAQAALVRAQHQREREGAERRRRLELEKKTRALRNVARCEACRSFAKAPLPPDLGLRDPPQGAGLDSLDQECSCDTGRRGPAMRPRTRRTARAAACSRLQQEQGALAGEARRLRSREAEARRLAVSVLCGFELEARLRERDADRLRRRHLSELRQLRRVDADVAEIEHWRQHARRLEDYCVHVLWSPQGQLQGVLDENQQLRNQLGHLRAHNASLASQLEEQFEESARCLAEISSSLEAEVDAGYSVRARRGRSAVAVALAAPRGPVRAEAVAAHSIRQMDVPAGPQGRPGARVAPGRVSRVSTGSDRQHNIEADPEPEPEPWDYSDHADLYDSGFWSVQASPPRSASAPTPSPARLCWLPPGPTPSSAAPRVMSSAATPSASGASTFILNTRR